VHYAEPETVFGFVSPGAAQDWIEGTKPRDVPADADQAKRKSPQTEAGL